MTSSFRIAASVSAALVAFAPVAHGQKLDCARKLSALEADVAAGARGLSQLEAALIRIDTEVDALVDETFSSSACSDAAGGTAARIKSDLAALNIPDLQKHADGNLVCAQFFSGRISRDLRAARDEGDARRVMMLGAIMDRILALDADATRQAVDAFSFHSKAVRLAEGAEGTTAMCDVLGDIYE